ncbi:MAG TPA: DUF6543 domain-containing protein [Pseudomonas sp.]|nr:DUF6543 domain-containing protein [Pseudomonas sp.]
MLDPDAPVMLWCGVAGWGRFTSMAQLQDKLNRDLQGAGREHWLKLMSVRDRTSLRSFVRSAPADQVQLRLDRIDGHVIEALQQQVLNRKQQDLQYLCMNASRCRFAAGLFTCMAGEAEVDGQLTEILDGLSMRIDASIFEAMLPSWLSSASTADLEQFSKMFKRFYLASDGGKDFLFDVPSLQDLARERLDARLSVDFPQLQLDPDQVCVTSHRYISAFPAAGEVPSAIAAATVTHTESLTDYTINRFVGYRDSALSVESAGNEQLAQSLTPDYLRKLIDELDVGRRYKALLRQVLSPDDTQYAQRHRLFIEQFPIAMQAVALTAKVQGAISPRAYEYISRVLEMPDGIAREAIDGVRVIISPLQLVADRGLTPDTVAGVYVIFPNTLGAGPVLLYAIYHSAFVFREYTSREALAAAIRTDESLQQLMLQRVEPQVYRRYAHGGFSEPHLASSVGLFDFDIPLRRPGPVVLATVEEKGNALQLLFDGTAKVLLDMDLDGAVTNEQVDRAGRSFLATLGLEQVLCLLPGKWATLVTLWQSHILLRASAVSISGHRWGEALSEFSAALGVMVTARQQEVAERLPREEAFQERASSEQPAIVVADGQDASSGSAWGSISLTAEQRIRLQELEARNMALNKMRRDPLLNLYLDDSSKTAYAAMQGKVFEVRQLPGGEWIIMGADGTTGPHVVIDGNQRWQLDLTPRLRGGGGIVTRLQASVAMSSVAEVMVVEASGMAEIRALYRDRARHIGQAHGQAKRYLENCLDNLSLRQPGAALDSRVEALIGDFFGTTRPDAQLLSRIENLVRSLFAQVMDASLSPYSSPRFVIGSNRPGHEGAMAFIVPADPRRRLFLTERFFRAPFYRLKPEAVAEGFDPLLHSQASVLIHELSHQTLDTRDIAYLEANAPYPDLLVQNTPSSLRRLAEVERLHDAQLSHRTAESELFKYFENGQWRDINRQDRAGYSAILQITGTRTLGEARKVFLADVHKRSQVMLHNADSVALLIVRLGRHNYIVPTP